MTLAFELAAVEQFAHPNEVVADAREWSQYVGVVSNDADAVTSYVQKHDLQQDFDLRDRDKWLALAEIRDGTDTDRYVFVGSGPEDRRVAEQVGWEFVSVDEAAEKAGWTLGVQTKGAAGILDRLRTYFLDSSLWSSDN